VSRERYAGRLSAPLLDRFDIAIRVHRPETRELIDATPGESSSAVAGRVDRARLRASERGVTCNAQLPAPALGELAPMSEAATSVVEKELRAGSLTARGMHRIQRLARTVADLDDAGPVIQEAQIREALLLRSERELLLGGSRR
jgi:magnesium chelatase family protein